MSAALLASDLFSAAEATGVTSFDRPKWLAMRRTMVTASSTAALFDASPFQTALELYVEMISPPPPTYLAITDPRFWGLALERAIFESAAAYYGWEAVPGGELLRSKAHPLLGCTLDGAIKPANDTIWLPYEGKTTAAWRAKDWNEDTGEAPTHIVIQAQHQLLVTGAPRVLVFCLAGGNKPIPVMIEADAEFHGAIVEEATRFLAMVRELTPPEPTGRDSDGRALSRLFPREDGTIVRLPPEAVEWTREYQKATAEIADATNRRKRYQQLIKRAVGAATYGVLPEPVGEDAAWRWATQTDGKRVLRALKRAPTGVPVAHLPPAKDALFEELQASVDAGEAAPIRFTQGKRTRRR